MKNWEKRYASVDDGRDDENNEALNNFYENFGKIEEDPDEFQAHRLKKIFKDHRGNPQDIINALKDHLEKTQNNDYWEQYPSANESDLPPHYKGSKWAKRYSSTKTAIDLSVIPHALNAVGHFVAPYVNTVKQPITDLINESNNSPATPDLAHYTEHVVNSLGAAGAPAAAGAAANPIKNKIQDISDRSKSRAEQKDIQKKWDATANDPSILNKKQQ